MSNQNTALSKAEQNALSVSYEVLGTTVELDLQFVKNYLVRGRADLVSDQEIVFFMNTCKMQKLNPLVNGEVYLIKYSKDQPAQMVVGKDAYVRRGRLHPDYLESEDGIIVQRSNQFIQKEGCCLYPGEVLIGGWCRVHYNKGGKERTAYKEVSLMEYSSNQANWKSKPATMINKVAVSQCYRAAFPRDFEGLYSEDELVASGVIEVEPAETGAAETVVAENDPIITQEQRRELFGTAKEHFGESGNEIVKGIVGQLGLTSTTDMTTSQWEAAMSLLRQEIDNKPVDVDYEPVDEDAEGSEPSEVE